MFNLQLQVPTAVFTPLQYGAVGLNEQEAIAEYGKHNIEVNFSVYVLYMFDLLFNESIHLASGFPQLVQLPSFVYICFPF